MAAERERNRLKEENEQMQSILKQVCPCLCGRHCTVLFTPYVVCVQFLEGISVTEDTVRGANPLLVVNGASNTLPMPVREAAAVPVIESSHMVNTGRVGGALF